MKYAVLIIAVLLLSCANDTRQKPGDLAANYGMYETIPKVESTEVIPPVLQEFFADSLHIGRKGSHKIELSKYSSQDSDYVQIRFFTGKTKAWKLQDEFTILKDGVLACDPQLSDYNNDGLKDLTFVSAVAARGANEIRTLLLYDRKTDHLILVKNSSSYPNLRYNKQLNCLDAFLVYGGCSTVFLKIAGDSLRPFAQVDLMDGLTVTEYDPKGKAKIILEDKSNKAGFIRYKNYKPLEEAEYY